jgi:hypothetical protein
MPRAYGPGPPPTVPARCLRIAAGLDPTRGIDPAGTGSEPITFDDYGLVLGWATETAQAIDCPIVTVERALYELSRRVTGKPGRTWGDYAEATLERLVLGPT